jgi:pyruvate formate lyase activating enzyme
MTTGLVTNIQRYALQDGPGIRTTVFLKGCPLACAWCHNPENISRQPQVMVVETRCLRCGECLAACPQPSAAVLAPDPVTLRAPAGCTHCGACVDACPTGARTLLGQEWTVEEVMNAVVRDRLFYESSGGGLTVSGGEPLLQFDFLQALLAAAKAEEIHTALDTCGFAPEGRLLELLPLVDLFLYDLKAINEEQHLRLTGVSNRLILDNLRRLADLQAQLWLRIPIVPGVNDDPAELELLAQFAASLGRVRQVNLLPYHTTGIGKVHRLHQVYALDHVVPPSPERMLELAGIFIAQGLNAKIGG